MQPAGMWNTSMNMDWMRFTTEPIICMWYASSMRMGRGLSGSLASFLSLKGFKTSLNHECMWALSMHALGWHAYFLSVGYVLNSLMALCPSLAPLKIRKVGNIWPLAVTVDAIVTHFVLVINIWTWIVFVPFASSIVFGWKEYEIGVWSISWMLGLVHGVLDKTMHHKTQLILGEIRQWSRAVAWLIIYLNCQWE